MVTAMDVLSKVQLEEGDETKERQDRAGAKPVSGNDAGTPSRALVRIKNEWLRVCEETEQEIFISRRVLCREDLEKVLFVIRAYFSPAFFPLESVMAADVDCPQCYAAEGEWDRAKKHAIEERTSARRREDDGKVSMNDIRAWMESKGLGHHFDHLENCPANMLWDYVLFTKIVEQRAAEARVGTYDFLKRAFRPLTGKNQRKKNQRMELPPWKQVLMELLGVVPDVSFPKNRKQGFPS